MPTRPRPVIAVRLIGPADVVAAHKAHLIDHFTSTYGNRATCRTSTRHASHVGVCRTYLTVTLEGAPMTPDPLRHNVIPSLDRKENVQ